MKKWYGYFYSFGLTFWLFVFFVLPSSLVFLYSFLKKSPFGGVEWEFSLEAFRFLFSPTTLHIAWNTLLISLGVVLLTMVLAIPTAYAIVKSKHKEMWLFLIIIPFWVNFLIRIYAWIAILGNNGFINNALLKIGLLSDNLQFLYNPYAVIIITVYTYLPYAILPLYASIEKFDFGLLEAAKDLGATHLYGLRKIFLPSIKGGIYAAFLFTFIPSLGSYAVPQLVGGKDGIMLGNVIAREITIARNYPVAAALSLILMVLTMVGVVLFMKKNKLEEQEKKR